MHRCSTLGVAGAGLYRAAEALDRMVAAAGASRMDKLLMIVPPQRRKGASALVPSFNDRIRSISALRGAVLIDVHRLLLTGSCTGVQPIPCIGRDGLHPTEQGYRLIAEEIERALVARYDVEILSAADQPDDASGTQAPLGVEPVSRRRP